MQLKGKTKIWVVWDLSLENFYNRLLVWIEFKFVLNYYKILFLSQNMVAVFFRKKTWFVVWDLSLNFF